MTTKIMEACDGHDVEDDDSQPAEACDLARARALNKDDDNKWAARLCCRQISDRLLDKRTTNTRWLVLDKRFVSQRDNNKRAYRRPFGLVVMNLLEL